MDIYWKKRSRKASFLFRRLDNLKESAYNKEVLFKNEQFESQTVWKMNNCRNVIWIRGRKRWRKEAWEEWITELVL